MLSPRAIRMEMLNQRVRHLQHSLEDLRYHAAEQDRVHQLEVRRLKADNQQLREQLRQLHIVNKKLSKALDKHNERSQKGATSYGAADHAHFVEVAIEKRQEALAASQDNAELRKQILVKNRTLVEVKRQLADAEEEIFQTKLNADKRVEKSLREQERLERANKKLRLDVRMVVQDYAHRAAHSNPNLDLPVALPLYLLDKLVQTQRELQQYKALNAKLCANQALLRRDLHVIDQHSREASKDQQQQTQRISYLEKKNSVVEAELDVMKSAYQAMASQSQSSDMRAHFGDVEDSTRDSVEDAKEKPSERRSRRRRSSRLLSRRRQSAVEQTARDPADAKQSEPQGDNSLLDALPASKGDDDPSAAGSAKQSRDFRRSLRMSVRRREKLVQTMLVPPTGTDEAKQ